MRPVRLAGKGKPGCRVKSREQMVSGVTWLTASAKTLAPDFVHRLSGRTAAF